MKPTGTDINSIVNLIQRRHDIVSDEELRDKHPALQEAWEQYQILYKLCKEVKA